MGTHYYRRYRMEFDLLQHEVPEPTLPDGYHWIGWDSQLVERHAQVKYASFRDEMDSGVFASLGKLDGCRRLMSEITGHRSFLPPVTWIIGFQPDPEFPSHDCATIQGLARTESLGAVQNVGVVPEHRGFGLGRALTLKALQGFRDSGLTRVYLEVTAGNTPAVELYKSVGFHRTRTMYKAVEIAANVYQVTN